MFAARMALDGAGHLSKIVQLEVAQFVNDAFGLLAEDHWVVLGFLRSSQIDFVYEPFVFVQFALHPSRLHREQFLQLWGRLSIQAFLKQMNLSRSSWILHWLFLHQVPRRSFPAASKCTFRSVLLLLRLLRLPRTLEYNLWWKSRRSDGTELHSTMAFDRVCQGCSPLFCALVFFYTSRQCPEIVFHFLRLCYISRFREVVAWPFFFWIVLRQRI